ncbi:MAG: hydrogenase nickel incorporation protein HypB, partial [Candidatus Ranarchaeia archaeon]
MEKDPKIKITTFKKNNIEELEINKDILIASKKNATINENIFRDTNTRAFDLLGSVGAGKTSILEQVSKTLNKDSRILIVNGDLTTTIDADRIRRHGVEVIQIQTGRQCHLDPHLLLKSLSSIDLNNYDLLFIENVGNLICPSEYPLGTEKRIVVISVTEGPYMVLKHPFTFINTDIVLINKIDLVKQMEVDPAKLEN